MILTIYKALTLIDYSLLVPTQSTINVGSKTYVFVSGAPVGDQIQIGASNNATATNINTKINADLVTSQLQSTNLINNYIGLIGLADGSNFTLSTNTPDAFILDSDSLSKYRVGNWWINGMMAKSYFRTPSLALYLKNVKRLIKKEQYFVFNQLNQDENANLLPFYPERIHLGLVPDLNNHALYITGRKSSSSASGNSKIEEIIIKIVATTGPDDTYDESYAKSNQYLQAIQSIFESTDSRELILGWSGAITNIEMKDNSDNPQATIIIAELGAIPELNINIRVTAVMQRMN